MKKIIFWTITGGSFILLGFLIYFASMNSISNKVMTEVAGSITEDDLAMLASDPNVEALLGSSEDDLIAVDLQKTSLPIKTKEEAMKKISESFSIDEIQKSASKVKGGLTAAEKNELYSLLTERLSEEELTALKIIAVQEAKHAH
ncbi:MULTISPECIES: hypothetical protein [Bacillaceae]|uniref:Uncharacterized protein n=2 Tax=Cytobacillus firmus TaxID=1399 RepID=A0A0J5W1V4_CYTFI|nr:MULTISPECIES: hypothetical protein [Bacillaceae]KML40905.1 hypothetical protein VL14_12905 [Cytobacillus firmus]MBG9543389.1 hypothetical protein [Cytobacillus firmus]MBG9548435.1 hypothetical protein [Cytobacillus firmus]MBG9553839.1 hypothetical protein [Cytobacillus firmus]MBG9558749.1 hypothetical protein [Cytobacillus firmus]